MKKTMSLLLIFVLALCMFTGCGKDNTADKPTEIVVSAGAGSQITSGNFDPLQGFMKQGFFLLHSPLLTYDANLNMVNDLADGDFTVSADGLEYTFKIRDDAYFSDGSKVKASDVAFTYTKMKDAGLDIDVSAMDHAEVIDDRTVKFVLSTPQSTFLDQVCLIGIVPEALYNENYAATGVGSGPWKVVQCDVDQQTIVEPNEYYYGQKPYFTKVTFVNLDEKAVISALKAGEIDVADISAEYAVEKIEGMHLVTVDTIDVRMMTMPTTPVHERASDGKTVGNPVTSDPAIRKAINIGIDRDKVIEEAYNSIGKEGSGMIGAYAPDLSFEDGRVEEAKKLLEDAGWVDTDGDGIREKNGVKAEFNVYSMAVQMERYYCSLAVANQAKELGILMNCFSVESSETVANKWTSPVIYSLGEYTANQVKSWYYTGTRMNCASYSNPEVDRYIEAAIAATSIEEANNNWKKAQEIASEDLPYIFLVNLEHCIMVRDGLDLGKQIPNPHGHGAPIIGTMNQWKWEK